MIGSLDWPVTWIEGIGTRPAGPLDGMHVLAVGGAAVETIRREGTPVARVYDDGAARHLLAGDLTPPDVDAPPADQARAALERLDAVLAEAGLGLDAWAAGRGIPPLPLVRTATTICRDDLLYEIEVDAADPRGSGKAVGSREA